MKKIFFPAIALGLMLTACESGYKKSPVVTPQRMVCANGSPAQITFYSPQEARLVFEEKSYNLERIDSVSGIKYANSSISYWNKGIEAMIIRSDNSTTTCTCVPQKGL